VKTVRTGECNWNFVCIF